MTDFNDPKTIHLRLESLKYEIRIYQRAVHEAQAKLKEAKRVYDKAILDRILAERKSQTAA